MDLQDKEDQAVYFDAHIIEIKREVHDINGCQCVFLVRYDHDFFEVITQLSLLSADL